MVQPETKYARMGQDRIAYQVLGQGPPDLVMALPSLGHVDLVFEDVGLALFLRSLSSFSRLIFFNRRGSGASDPLPHDPLPTWESHAEELATVLDEVGSERAALLAEADVGPTALFFAGTRPERTAALILVHTSAKFGAADDYPIGIPTEVAEALLAQIDQLWGTEPWSPWWRPAAPTTRGSAAGSSSCSAAPPPHGWSRPGSAPSWKGDLRPLLPLIQAPTLILHRPAFQLIPIQHSRYLAYHIPGAKLVELPGADGTLIWETPELALDLIQEFLTGVRRVGSATRLLATVLFTDIIGSTQQASRLGDRRWRELLNVHDDLVRRLVEEFGGQLIKTTGDGILATFDGPGRAISCAAAINEELGGIGLQIRAGLHTGEIERRDGDVGGLAVHIAARVMATAGPGEIVGSRTVRDLVVGSDIGLQDRGAQPLKGIEGTWQLFAVMGR
jgi:class 3 adenylate cyclase